jgi:hypothetical protein
MPQPPDADLLATVSLQVLDPSDVVPLHCVPVT